MLEPGQKNLIYSRRRQLGVLRHGKQLKARNGVFQKTAILLLGVMQS